MIKHRLLEVLAVGLVLVLSACGGKTTTPTNPTNGTVVDSKNGGTVKGPDGVQVVVPPGAVDKDTKIEIKKTTETAASLNPSGIKLGDANTPVYEVTPHDVEFKQPVTIRLPLPAGVTNPVVYVSETGVGWYAHKNTVKDGFVELQRTRFSSYVVAQTSGRRPSDIYWADYTDVVTVTDQFIYLPKGGIVDNQIEVNSTVKAYLASFAYSMTIGTWTLKQNVPATVEFSAITTSTGTTSSMYGSWLISKLVRPIENCANPKVFGLLIASDADWISGKGLTKLPELPLAINQRTATATLTFTPPSTDTAKAFFALSCNQETDFKKMLGIFVNYSVLPTYAVKGSVSGLPAGKTVELSNAGKTLTSGGSFEFLGLDSGAAYDVTVSKQPDNYNCTVSNGSGTMGSANVTNVAVSCLPTFHAVKGTVSGLPQGSTVELVNNDTVIEASNSFSFPDIPEGETYEVKVSTQPQGYFCTVSNGSGTMGKADVTNVAVTCAARQPRSIGGSVSGLGNLEVAKLKLGSEILEKTNGNFIFTTKLEDGSNYVVVVESPSASICKFTAGNGTIFPGGDFFGTTYGPDQLIYGSISGANISNLAVSCVPKPFTLGGTVSGMPSGGSVVLKNGSETLSVSANGGFTFVTAIPVGSTYSVSVNSSPANYSCTVANGSGTMGSANVTNVAVSCTENPKYTVGGTVSGLSQGKSITLSNGSNSMSSGSGSFTLPGSFYSGTAYSVTISNKPANYNCTVEGGSGTIASANVTNVAVNCVEIKYTVGGTVSGLPSGGSVVLKNNGGDNLTVSSNTSFTFATSLSSGATYSVAVATNPASYNCTVENGSGTITSANITNVAVTCAVAPTYSVGGTISGLTTNQLDVVELQLNGGETLSKRNGIFTFVTKVSQGGSFTVSIPSVGFSDCEFTDGSGTISENGLSISGTMGGANISDLEVTCTQGTGGGGPYSISGTVQGLIDGAGYTLTVTLSHNGSNETITVDFDTDNTFDFVTEIPEGNTYTVTASTANSQSDPPMQCGVFPSGSQTANADATVTVSCQAGPPGPPGP